MQQTIHFDWDDMLSDPLASTSGVLAVLFVVVLVALGSYLFLCGGRARKGYDRQVYWDRRYDIAWESGDRNHEWYTVDERLVELLVSRLSTYGHGGGDGDRDRGAVRVLDLGCGLSKLNEMLYDAGFTAMTSVDFSSSCIEGRSLAEKTRKIAYLSMDARNLRFGPHNFDAVVDKATLDSITFEGDSVAARNASRVVKEICRVLRPGGTLVSVSLNNHERWCGYWAHPLLKIVHEELLVIPRAASGAQEQAQSESSNVNINVYVYTCERLPDSKQPTSR